MHLNPVQNSKIFSLLLLSLLLLLLSPTARANCAFNLAAASKANSDAQTTNSYVALKLSVGMPLSTVASSPALNPWINVSRYQPATIPEIRVETMRKATRLTPDPFMSCGVCHQMSRMHLQATVMPVLNYLGYLKRDQHLAIDSRAGITSGKFVLVFVKGELVGAVKLLGAEPYNFDGKGRITETSTPTFLALRNVTDGRGQLSVAMGGIYEISRTFYADVIRPEINKHGSFEVEGIHDVHNPPVRVRKFLLDYQVGAVDVKSLDLYSKTFLLNDIALPDNAGFFDGLYASGFDVNNSNYRSDLWRSILASLETVRSGLQKEYRADPQFFNLRRSLQAYPQPDIRDAVHFDILEM